MFSVAYGACVQAATLSQKPDAPSMYVRNVIPLTISIACVDTKDGKNTIFCVPILFRNTAYPFQKSIKARTSKDFQTKAKIRLYEGEHYKPQKNKLLGTMVIDGLNASVKGLETLDIFVKIDENGILTSVAIDRNTKLQSTLKIEKPNQLSELVLLNMAMTVDQLRQAAIKQELTQTLNWNLKPVASMDKRKKTENFEFSGRNDACPIYGYDLPRVGSICNPIDLYDETNEVEGEREGGE